MPSGQPIPTPKAASHRDATPSQPSSWVGTPRVEDVLARDLAECSDDEPQDEEDDSVDSGSQDYGVPGPTMYRRPSGVAFGTSRPVMNYQLNEDDSPFLTRVELKQSRDAERSLLRDNHVLPPKHPERDEPDASVFWRVYRRVFSTKTKVVARGGADEETAPQITVQPADESTPLLVGGPSAAAAHIGEHLDERWEAAVASGALRTTWQREAKTIITYALPLVITFFLQYSINVVAIFTVGKIGKVELGAVSLAAMTASITCYAPMQGLATSLDTLCSQAYGSGHRHLVGLQLQRMTAFLLLAFIPVAVLWLHADRVLVYLIPERETAILTGRYLRVLIFGGPAFACFEGGKRYVQAQGLFRATTWVLLVVAPFNIFVNWLLVWKLEMGFIGAPVAVVVSQNMLPLLLLLYVRFVDGSQCWGGFSRRALTNWGIMLRLALPGMIMIQAEYMAFELLTLASSRFGASHLAAQSVLVTLTSVSFQIPFPVSIAASTRIANLIGAGLVDAARTTAKVAVGAAWLTGLMNLALFWSLRYRLPLLFTNDPEVVEVVAAVLPLCAVMQVFDGLCAGAGGLLRGIGRPAIGGYANLGVYYLVALPISFGTAFGLDMKLQGLWLGVTLGLALVSGIEFAFVYFTDWHKAAREAERRNAAG
ncbi:mate-domain-containing protein [Plectosphaerella plurivora]|uniref:Mate-domain-containing protein n=1 Tax=Plectosphaerella plurivora TaxID=936078 RepID=A0A9P9A7V4_9PEZI|nr:mate-domain-containing protein [Plectosphaerella plurivora]